jgi:hypothetical protein
MRAARPSCARKSRNADAVVANPRNTDTQVSELADHFTQRGIFPPTLPTSVMRNVSNVAYIVVFHDAIRPEI